MKKISKLRYFFGRLFGSINGAMEIEISPELQELLDKTRPVDECIKDLKKNTGGEMKSLSYETLLNLIDKFKLPMSMRLYSNEKEFESLPDCKCKELNERYKKLKSEYDEKWAEVDELNELLIIATEDVNELNELIEYLDVERGRYRKALEKISHMSSNHFHLEKVMQKIATEALKEDNG